GGAKTSEEVYRRASNGAKAAGYIRGSRTPGARRNPAPHSSTKEGPMQLPYHLREIGYRLLGAVPIRVRSGINRGRRWSLASTGRGYGSGRFGQDRLAALAAVVRPGETFWDLGAHKGFMTL